eukprot:scaffold143853_cov33-Tisochrysis_lutea.AAC.1
MNSPSTPSSSAHLQSETRRIGAPRRTSVEIDEHPGGPEVGHPLGQSVEHVCHRIEAALLPPAGAPHLLKMESKEVSAVRGGERGERVSPLGECALEVVEYTAHVVRH